MYYFQGGAAVECLRNYIFGCCLFYLSLTDLDEQTIPDCTLILAAAAFALAAFVMPFADVSIGITPFIIICRFITDLFSGVIVGLLMLGTSLLLQIVFRKPCMGGGDLKLLAICGLYLGFRETLFAILIACLLGLPMALIRRREFPFGPAIAGGAWFMLQYGVLFR